MESLNYSALSLIAKFGKRISATHADQHGRTSTHAEDQQAIGNIIYGGTRGSSNPSNTRAGDGYTFRGRCLVQTTAMRLYALFGHADNPDAVGSLEVSA